ncbi:hypothetical protein ACKUV4_018190 [Acinetobacter baumannii]
MEVGKEGIPLRTQALLEIKSKGILKADLLSKSSQSLIKKPPSVTAEAVLCFGANQNE